VNYISADRKQLADGIYQAITLPYSAFCYNGNFGYFPEFLQSVAKWLF